MFVACNAGVCGGTGDSCGTELAMSLAGSTRGRGRSLLNAQADAEIAAQIEADIKALVAATLNYPLDLVTVTASRSDGPGSDWNVRRRPLWDLKMAVMPSI